MLENLEMLQSDLTPRIAMAAGQPAAIDHAHLRRYTMGDLQLEHEVLDLFASELPRTLASLQAAATIKDWKMAAHTLKGSARAVGAWRVAAAAVDAERISDAINDTFGKRAVLVSCEHAVREAVGYISALSAPQTLRR
jgi:HPt (histidine-containing phosphotransfer) domain-containing protein